MKIFKAGTTGKKSWKKWLIIGIIVLAILAGAAAGGGLIWYRYNLAPVDATATEDKLITIEKGRSADAIAVLLEEKGLIRSSTAFSFYVGRQGVKNKLKAGTYQLKSSLSVAEISDKLVKGDVAKRTVTFTPGRRLDQLRAEMIEAGFEEAKVDNALKTAGRQKLSGILPKGATLEGYLFADTYITGLDQVPDTIVNLSIDQLLKNLTSSVKEGIQKQGLTLHEGIILASIIQKESSNPEDQKQIAQVFYKRLKEGISLGADATTRYGVNKPSGPLTAADLASNSPYNTRKFKGLTPGPIGNFNKSALEAVAFPAEGDYLFFVAGNDRVTRFARTNAEHEALKAQYGVSAEE